MFFLRCLVRQKDRLAKRIDTEQNILSDLSGLAASIVNLLATEGKTTVARVVESLGANRNTAKMALQGLVKRGLISQRGKGRGVHYTLLPGGDLKTIKSLRRGLEEMEAGRTVDAKLVHKRLRRTRGLK